MPELAEVEHYRRRWDVGLGGRIQAVLLHPRTRVFRGTSATLVASRLRGQTLLASWAHGKQMLFQFSGGNWLGLHLGMTGELRVEKFPVRPKRRSLQARLDPAHAPFPPGRHDHLVLQQAQHALVFADPRQFGRVRLAHGSKPPPWWTALPPAITSARFTVSEVGTFLRRRARSPIKAVLLLQECFPGIGNWMADEILWRAQVHPRTPAGQLADSADRLWTEIRWVADEALRIVAPDYADPPSTWLFPHRWRAHGLCPRDGHALQRATIGGRTTAWCNHCQTPLPRQRPRRRISRP